MCARNSSSFEAGMTNLVEIALWRQNTRVHFPESTWYRFTYSWLVGDWKVEITFSTSSDKSTITGSDKNANLFIASSLEIWKWVQEQYNFLLRRFGGQDTLNGKVDYKVYFEMEVVATTKKCQRNQFFASERRDDQCFQPTRQNGHCVRKARPNFIYSVSNA